MRGSRGLIGTGSSGRVRAFLPFEAEQKKSLVVGLVGWRYEEAEVGTNSVEGLIGCWEEGNQESGQGLSGERVKEAK